MDDLEKSLELASNFKHIWYEEKISKAYQELLDTDPDKVLKRWWQEWDDMLWWIYTWKVYLIWADTWVWKTTFVNQVCRNVSKTWVRVVKYSLEDRMEDIWKEELYYQVNKLRWHDWYKPYKWTDFVNNAIWWDEFINYVNKASDLLMKENIIELDKNKQVNIDELVELMEEECYNWTKLFAIDHLHYFEFQNWWERLDLQIQNVMHRINEIARKRNVAILLVAHYRNNKPKMDIWSRPDPARFKDWASIKQVANIIIQIERDWESTTSYFYITKLRWPIKPDCLETEFNISTFEYSFKKSEEQIKRESIYMK